MNAIRKSAEDFLKKNGMLYKDIDVQEACRTFVFEMEQGLEGRESSLAMIPTYVSADARAQAGRPVIVIDAGGTNFRVAVVSFASGGAPVIEAYSSYPMPGSQGEITRDEFFQAIVSCLLPVIDKSDRIGFCFSYPTEILPNVDGRVINLNKEVRVRGIEGTVVGRTLMEYLDRAGHPGNRKFALINDTAATLLGGMAAASGRPFSGYIGFILGTGTNTCYAEQNVNIRKAPLLAQRPGASLVNLEAGGYGRAPSGRIDDLMDRRTATPGDHRFEKMISGAYQGSLILETIRCAAEDGLFSHGFCDGLSRLKALSSREIDDFCYYPAGENALALCAGVNETDRLTAYLIIDALMERTALLSAVNLCAVALKTGAGRNPCYPICISAEGTTFYKSKLLRGKLDYYIRTLLNEKAGVFCEFIRAENATLIGTALAVGD